MADITDQGGVLGADDYAQTLTESPESESAETQAQEIAEAAQRKADEELLARVKASVELAVDGEDQIRKLSKEDLEFSVGDQWPANVKQERERDGRPCLTVNRIPQFVHQVTNDQRQNRPAIKVHPVSDGADEDTAKIIQGIIRHIEYNSSADVAYNTAFDFAVRGGFGFWRLITAYARPDSFDQEILIKRIKDTMTAYIDPSCQEPDGSDAEWGFIVEYLTKEEFKRQYPDAEATSSDWSTIGSRAPLWMKGEATAVVEYIYKEYSNEKIHQLSTGETVYEKDLEARLAQAAAAGLEVEVALSRTARVPHVKSIKCTALEILDRTDIPGRFIPIVPVYGSDITIDGDRKLEGIVRQAKDPQRMLNYWRSAETEAIALAPRAPFIGAEGQFEGHERKWQEANRKNHPYLEYKATTLNGQPVAPPQRQAFEPAVQAITQASMQAADDLKATTGIYDPSLGAGATDTSGIAIQRRNIQAQTSNFHFVDNLTRALKYTGRILVEWIPVVYDAARTARIIGEDGAQKLVPINQEHEDESGNKRIYDLDAGLYDVTIDVGPSYASKRQEAAASMMDFSRAVPAVAQQCADLIVKNLDWPGANEMADRLRKLLPPGLADDGKNKNVPPQLLAQLQQQQQQIQQLSQMYHEAQDQIDKKLPELQSRERIEMAKIQADLEINAAKLNAQGSIALLEQQIAQLMHRDKLMSATQAAQSAIESPDAAAGAMADPQDPTGGQSPGSPMEGM